MALPPITPTAMGVQISPILPTTPGAAPSGTAGAADGTEGSGASSFADALTGALDSLAESHATADSLALEAATGDLTAVHDYTIAATEAQLMTQLTVEVRNRAVEAFNDIMRMQV